MLNNAQQALAQSHTYHLLGKLLLVGVDAETLARVQQIPPLAEHLPEPVDMDALAADHQHLFRFEIFAHQGIFLDPEANIGGEETRRVIESYLAAGFPIVDKGESADHIGAELQFLAYLSKIEAVALDEDQADEAGRAAEHARSFLDGHVLRWLPALIAALSLQGDGLFVAAARLALEVAMHHRGALGGGAAGGGFALIGDEGLLEDAGTGLRDISTFFLSPARSGLFLGRQDIRALSRRHNLPAGFGSRQIMLNNLLRSAAEYDGMSDTLDAIEQHLEAHRAQHATIQDDHPSLAVICGVWVDRLTQTSRVVDKLRTASLALGEPDPAQGGLK